ncbi:AAA family ATPase [Azospirillum melinis]|uniref:AAA family ATPase n=1 Tax=Azospirillum melinis TaxID=328839 RepID=A0ABX2KT79_9PROT|nr:ParA family protein [Azospirillum melinis]MBP2310466.1 chromosome partitioning protein [Azospirillum melinis]NUB03772.1 AAA family ATPase [Azospirillum melinis]
MKVLAVHSQKGGSGKTTLSAHLSVQAARLGHRVLIVDLDPQESVRKWWDRRVADDVTLSVNPPVAGIKAAAKEHGCDLVVIDTPPRSAATTLAALELANLVLIPCRPSIVDVDALDKVVELVARARAKSKHAVIINHAPAPRGVIQAEAGVVADSRSAIEAQFKLTVAPTVICDRAAFRHAMNDGRAVAEFEPAGKAAGEINSLWSYIQERI